jgi:hypothetical protein
MEPLSALGIATAVVQFLDFTANVVSGTHKIYVNSPDHAHRNIDLKQISTSLVTLNDEITNSLDTAHTQQRSVRDQQLDGLARRCNELGNRLLATLERLESNRKRTLWGSFRLALRSVWSESELESMEKALEGYQRQISMHLLVSIRYILFDDPSVPIALFLTTRAPETKLLYPRVAIDLVLNPRPPIFGKPNLYVENYSRRLHKIQNGSRSTPKKQYIELTASRNTVTKTASPFRPLV